MELEVSKKVREAIKAKLLEIGCHVDDELPDYIMILIANRRSNTEIESDLSLFLADSTKKFVNWLIHVLKKLEQVTASGAGAVAAVTEEIKVNPSESSTKSVIKPNVPAKRPSTEKSKKKSEKKLKTSSPSEKLQKIVTKRSTKEGKGSTQKSKLKHSKKDSVAPVLKKAEPEPDSTTLENLQIPLSLPSVPKISSTVTIPNEGPKHKSNYTSPDKGLPKENEEKEIKVVSQMSEDEDFETLAIHAEPSAEVEKSEPMEMEIPPPVRSIVLNRSGPSPIKNQVQQLSPPKVKQQEELPPVVPLEESKDAWSTIQNDTLILHTEENEFVDSVEELRRIALESQERKRKDKANNDKQNLQQKKLIKDILMSTIKDKRPVRESTRSRNYKSIHSTKPVVEERRRILQSPRRQESRVESDKGRERKKIESPKRLGRSPTRSVFDRLAGKSYRSRRSRSRSPSPPPLRRSRLTSTIGNVISRAEQEYDPIRPSVSSVVKVTDRPKRDLNMSSKMLLRAVADAQKSIIQNEQSASKSESRKRKENCDKIITEVVEKRRFTEFPEVLSAEFFEPTKAAIRRRSIKERLGVKRDIRKSVKDRLGVVNNLVTDTNSTEETYIEEDDDADYYSKNEDYNILINVSDGSVGNGLINRNVTLASDVDMSKRISIQVNNSEEDDTSDECDSSSGSEDEKKQSKSKPRKMDRSGTYEGDFEHEFELEVSDEDKLPEVPESENEYVVEEIEVEESMKGSPPSSNVEEVQAPQQMPKQSATVQPVELSNPPTNFKITLGNATAIHKPVTPFTPLPDLRKKLSKPVDKSLPSTTPAPSTVRCKYWPKCQFKDKCVYDHPACRFNPCSNIKCMYKHDNSVDQSVSSSTKKVCKFYPKCTSMTCKYFHPSPCRFGIGCTDIKCKNYHPGVTIGVQKLKAKGVTIIPKVNELKWVKKV